MHDIAIQDPCRKDCARLPMSDSHTVSFPRYFETTRGETKERREVKWGTLYVNYEPTDVPSEWRMWLRKLRDNPPTDEEMAR